MNMSGFVRKPLQVETPRSYTQLVTQDGDLLGCVDAVDLVWLGGVACGWLEGLIIQTVLIMV